MGNLAPYFSFFFYFGKVMYVRSFAGGGASWVISRLTSAPAQSCAEAHSFTVLGRKTRPYLMLHPPSAILRTANLPFGSGYAVCIRRARFCEPQTFRLGGSMQSALLSIGALRTANLPFLRGYAVCIAFDWNFANRKPSVLEWVCSLHPPSAILRTDHLLFVSRFAV